MAMNRVQYQAGLPMLEFFENYGTHEQCEELVRAWRWPEGFICPRCSQTWHSEFRRGQRLYFQCSACRYQCSLVSGSVFESSKLPLPKWFLAMHLITQAKNSVSTLELMRHLGVSYPTAWLLKHKLMEVMRLREEGRRLTGRVEIDDAYLGGQLSGGKAGRGSPNKVAFVAAVQTTESGEAVLMCLSKRPFTKESVKSFAEQSLAAPATLVSDGLGCFRRPRHGHPARTARHRRWRRERQAPVVPGRQHDLGQPQNSPGRHVPRLRLPEVRPSLPRSGPVPVQPSLRPASHPHPLGKSRMSNQAVSTFRHSRG